MTDDPIVTIADVRSSGHCVAGARAWFDGYGLSFRTFIDEGMAASTLLATGDAYAIQAVECARKRLEAENGG